MERDTGTDTERSARTRPGHAVARTVGGRTPTTARSAAPVARTNRGRSDDGRPTATSRAGGFATRSSARHRSRQVWTWPSGCSLWDMRTPRGCSPAARTSRSSRSGSATAAFPPPSSTSTPCRMPTTLQSMLSPRSGGELSPLRRPTLHMQLAGSASRNPASLHLAPCSIGWDVVETHVAASLALISGGALLGAPASWCPTESSGNQTF